MNIPRDSVGKVVPGCELHWGPAEGAARHHHYVSVLRDLIGNVWVCEDHHDDQASAHLCARAELERRQAAGELKRSMSAP